MPAPWNSSGTRTVLAVVVVALAASSGRAEAQTRGSIFRTANATGAAVLDPNGDVFVSATTAGFVSNDVAESEIPYIVLPQASGETAGDSQGGAGGAADFVDIPASGASTLVYYSRGADGVRDTADDRLLFRIRLGRNPSGAFGYSILLDTDARLGAADTNAVAGNPGFEVEIALATGGAAQGVTMFDVDGRVAGIQRFTWSLLDSTQRSYALTTNDGDADVFIDLFVPVSALTSAFGVTSSTPSLEMRPARVSASLPSSGRAWGTSCMPPPE